jgi:hypothetical protein
MNELNVYNFEVSSHGEEFDDYDKRVSPRVIDEYSS